jgi:hypothetical protein
MLDTSKTIETKYYVYYVSFDLAALVDIKDTLEEATSLITGNEMSIREIRTMNGEIISQKDVYPLRESP